MLLTELEAMAKMKRRIISSVVFVLFITTCIAIAKECPIRCRCYFLAGSEGWTTKCNYKFLRVFPSGMDNGTEYLYLVGNRLTSTPEHALHLPRLHYLTFDHNRIATLHCETFSGLGKLQYLYLSRNLIDFIPNGCFEELISLKYLYLSSNSLKNLTYGLLQGLTELTYLDMATNQIRMVSDDTFQNTTRLSVLETIQQYNVLSRYLSRNYIHQLPTQCGRGLVSLEYLFVGNNYISSLPSGFLNSTTNLRGLSLASNKLTDISEGAFRNNRLLQYLNLESNEIRFVRGTTTSLERLYLSNNKLSSLPGSIFSNTTSLRELYLQDNRIASLPKGLFDHVFNLTHLSLSRNKLTDISEGAFSNNRLLQYLNLETNEIRFMGGTFSFLASLERLYLSNNKLSSLPGSIFSNLTNLRELRLSYNNIGSLPSGLFSSLTNLRLLRLTSMMLSSLENSTFSSLKSLKMMYMDFNGLQSLDEGIFFGLTKLYYLAIDNNNLISLPSGIFKSNPHLTVLSFGFNHLRYLHNDTFKNNILLKRVYFAGNDLTELPVGLFRNCRQIEEIVFENNKISKLPAGLLDGLSSLRRLGFSRNRISALPMDFLKDARGLKVLFLGMNNLLSLDINGITSLRLLMIHQNNLSVLDSNAIQSNRMWLEALLASYNNIKEIKDNTFRFMLRLRYVFLNDNKIRRISSSTFGGAFNLIILFLSDNPIEYIAPTSFSSVFQLQQLYLIGTKLKIVELNWFFNSVIGPTVEIITNSESGISRLGHTFIPYDIGIRSDLYNGLSSSGVQCENDPMKENDDRVCYACLVGFYLSYVETKRKFICNQCPAGGFYEDSLAYYGDRSGYGNGCKLCDNGTYVHPTRAPGFRKVDCEACPKGTRNDDFAGYRACRCQKTYYRLNRFDECFPCPSTGVTCFNESLTLKPGYYWQWVSESEKEFYMNFTQNLQIFDATYNKELAEFNGSFPQAYICPKMASCLGELDSNCAEGYQGPLCAVCARGHYRLVAACLKCPTLPWLIFQILMLLFVIAIIAVVIIKGRKRTSCDQRSLTDIVLARLKIIVSFYQISSGTLDAFSYIKWPPALIKINEYANFLQLNVLQIAPLHCFTSKLRMDAYSDLIFSCSSTTAVIMLALLYYLLKKAYLARKKKLYSKKMQSILATTREFCYRNLFLFLFVTYPQTCRTILQMLPAACHKICQDRDGRTCSYYLKADYSVTCFTEKYNKFVILVYVLLVYPVGVPLLTAAILWKYHYQKTLRKASRGANNSQNVVIRDRKVRGGNPVDNGTKGPVFGNQSDDKMGHKQETGKTNTERVHADSFVKRRRKRKLKSEVVEETSFEQASTALSKNKLKAAENEMPDTNLDAPDVSFSPNIKDIEDSENACMAKPVFKETSHELDQQGEQGNFSIQSPKAQLESGNIKNVNPSRVYSTSDHVKGTEDTKRDSTGVTAQIARVLRTTNKKKFAQAADAIFAAKKVRENRTVNAKVPLLPIIAGMSFIFENYAEHCWYWETIEMTRKLVLSSALVLIGAEGRTSLGVASIVSGFYAMLHAHYKPIPDSFEHTLQLTSLLVTFANTCIGVMLKIDQGALLDADQKMLDSLIITIMLVSANVMVTTMVVVKYIVAFGQMFYQFYKSPQCSLACCLTMMLTVNEAQGDARGLDDNKGWRMKSQLKRGGDFGGVSLQETAGDIGLLELEVDAPDTEDTEGQTDLSTEVEQEGEETEIAEGVRARKIKKTKKFMKNP